VEFQSERERINSLVVLIPVDPAPRSDSTCFTYLRVPRDARASGSNLIFIPPPCAPLRAWARIPAVRQARRPRRFREVETSGRISREKGRFRALRGLSTNNVHRRCSSPSSATPGDRGDTAISNRVLSLSFVLSLSLSLSLSCSLVPFVSHRLARSCMSKIRRTAHDKSCRDIDKPLLEIPARTSGPSGTPEFTKHRHGDKFADRGKRETRYRMISVIFESKYDTARSRVSRRETDRTRVRNYPLRVSCH